MRLKNISTLEHYLQEVSVISLLTDLDADAKHSIRSAASFFWHLDHSLGYVNALPCEPAWSHVFFAQVAFSQGGRGFELAASALF